MRCRLLVLSLLVFGFSGCVIELPEEKIDNIVRVLVHEVYYLDGGGQYSLFSINPSSKELTRKTYRVYKAKIYTDVPENQYMWARVTAYRQLGDKHYMLELHLHSPKDINGGGRQDGGRIKHDEQTEVLE